MAYAFPLQLGRHGWAVGEISGGFAFLKGTPILLKISFTIMIKIKYILPINHCNFIK